MIPGIADRKGVERYEIERDRRNVISVATFASEIADTPIWRPSQWSYHAEKIDREIGTGHPVLDEFFRYQFSPMSGVWIHEHPELATIESTFTRYYNVMRDHFENPAMQKLLRAPP